jgi:hypothetical protein
MTPSVSITASRWESSQAVDPDDDQRIALPDTAQHGLQLRAVAIGTGRVLAEDLGAAELLKIQDLPLGGLVLRAHSGVSDDGHDPIHAEGLAGGFAAVEPPFPRVSSGSGDFQALRLVTT